MKINKNHYVFTETLTVRNYDHEKNIFICKTKNSIADIYIPGVVLGATQTWIYPPLYQKTSYDAILDLNYHKIVMLNDRDYENEDSPLNDEHITKTYYPNAFKREIGKMQKLGKRTELDKQPKSLDYVLYYFEPTANYGTNGHYQLIPAEKADVNYLSSYFNRNSDEKTIIKTVTNEVKKVLSLEPDGLRWIGATIESSTLEGRLLDIFTNTVVDDKLEEYSSIFDDIYYNPDGDGIDADKLLSITSASDKSYVLYSLNNGIILSVPLEVVIFTGNDAFDFNNLKP